MSPFVYDADLATTETGRRFRSTTTVGDAMDDSIDYLFAEYGAAIGAGLTDLVSRIRAHAEAIDPGLLAELDGFDYPAAA